MDNETRTAIKGVLTGEVKTIIEDNMCSPNSGYTQEYANKCGNSFSKDYLNNRFGNLDEWEWIKSEYLN